MEQVKVTTTTVFETILTPLLPLLREQCAQLKDDAYTYKLSLEPFVLNLVFAVLNDVKSISLPITEIDSSTVARAIRPDKSIEVNVFRSVFPIPFNNLSKRVSSLA